MFVTTVRRIMMSNAFWFALELFWSVHEPNPCRSEAYRRAEAAACSTKRIINKQTAKQHWSPHRLPLKKSKKESGASNAAAAEPRLRYTPCDLWRHRSAVEISWLYTVRNNVRQRQMTLPRDSDGLLVYYYAAIPPGGRTCCKEREHFWRYSSPFS